VLEGLGLPTLRGAARGDQHVLLDVVVPARLSDEQRESAERLEASLSDENLDGREERAGRWGGRRKRARR